MHAQRPFILPIKGLKTGFHEYVLTAEDDFFASFPASPVQQAKLALKLGVDKRHGDIIIDFDFSGTIRTECDRCLAEVNFPVSGSERLMVQFTPDVDREPADPQLIYLHPDEHQLNVAPFAYEFFLLSLPMIRSFACREGEPPYPCDEEMLEQINRQSTPTDEPKKDPNQPSPWDALKNWKES